MNRSDFLFMGRPKELRSTPPEWKGVSRHCALYLIPQSGLKSCFLHQRSLTPDALPQPKRPLLPRGGANWILAQDGYSYNTRVHRKTAIRPK